MADQSPRRTFRVLTRTRGGYDGAIMYDVQLQVVGTRSLVWAQTFTDHEQATSFREEVEADLDGLGDEDFRRKYSIPSRT